MNNNVVAKHILDVAVGLEKKSKTELITELSDIFDNASKIDLNSKENIDSLKHLAKAFEAIFDKAGNKSIKFADLIEMPPPAMFAEMGKIAATSFWDAWNSVAGGMSANISKDMLREQFNQLNKQRTELVRKQKTLPRKLERLEELSQVSYMEQSEVHAFSKDELKGLEKQFGKSVDDIANNLLDSLTRGIDKLDGLKNDTPEFNEALEGAYQRMYDVLRMSRTLSKQPDLVKDKTILKDFNFDLLQEDYGGDLVEYDESLGNITRVIGDELRKIPSQLKEIDDQLLKIQTSGIEIVDQIEAKNGLKTLNEIEEAYKRILTHDKKREVRPNKQKVEKIENSLAFDPTMANQGIQSLYDQYLEAHDSGMWEDEYQALLKYVRLYEEYLHSDNKTHRNKVTRADNPFTPLYEQLKPMADNAKNALQNIVNMAKDQPLVGISETGSNGSGDTLDEVANAERIAEAKRLAAEAEAKARADAEAKAQAEKIAREEAEKKAQAEKANEESIKRQRVEQEKLAKAAEKERLAKEASDADIKDGGATHGNIQIILEDMNKFLSSNKDKKIEDYFELIAARAYEMSDDVKSAIETTIGSIDRLQSINIGANNHGGLIGDKSALILRKPDFNSDKQKWDTDKKNDDAIELQNRLRSANVSDVNLGKIQEVIKAEEYLVELQNRVSGDPISTIGESIEGINPDVLNATENSIRSLIQAMRELYNIGIESDVWNLGNILYDGQSDRFGIVDMDVKHDFESFEDMLRAFAQTVRNQVEDIANILNDPNMAQAWSRFADMVDSEVEKLKPPPSTADGFETTVDADDDAETLAKENGQLEDKLELLRDIAEQYGNNITQKQRDRYEELNQKDMDEGLTTKEDERYWELGEQIGEADSALEEFEQTYDRIIVKLANGKNIEILPNDKGLRILAKIDEEYGESYNGVEIEDVIYDRIQKEAVAAEQAVDSLNDSIEETKNISQGSGDVSSADLEAERAKVEALQGEVEQKNQELAVKDDEIARVQAESDAEKRALDDAKDTLQNDLDQTRQQLADAEYTRDLYDSAMNQLTEESNEKDRIIYDLREQLAGVKTGVSEEQASVSSEELKNVLSSIVYNVKIAHDDSDKTSNKIAIDESVLESTLKRVFTNVLNPQTEQNDSEPKNEPWALEKTLLDVKEVLGQIQTNTAKPESVEVAPAKTDVGNVLATENTLMAIKTAVESINSKVVKGTKAKTSESNGKKSGAGKKNDESYAGSQYFPEKLKTQTMQLAKFRAQLMTTGKLTDDVDAQIYELLNGLKQVQNGPDFSAWSQKFQQLKTSVGITDIFDKADGKDATASYQQLIEFQKTRNKLELQYEKAQDGSALKQFYAEQLAQMDNVIAKQEEMLENEEYEAKLAKIREEQARKLGEVEAKAADKDAKKQSANAKKLAQREAMLGKAGSAVGRAETTWMGAVDIDGLQTGFTTEIDEYYNKLDALRKKHQELKNSDMISEEQKKELIAQTMEINKMTSEIGELVAEYQKLSGDNATVIGSNTLGADAGLSAYEQQLKQTVMTATNGKAQIKSFDAATRTLTYTVKTGKNEFTEYTAAVRRADGALVSVQGTTKKTETFLEATKRKMTEISSYMSGMALLSRFGQELRRGIQYVREIDLALTELKKVTDETEETYDKFLDTAAKTGSRLGTTISAVTEATSTFAKLGYSMEQATEMAESAIVYKNVGDNIESTEDAANSIISTMKGFKLEATESMAIVDRFNEVGNRFAITSQGIGEALRLSASALSEGGNSLDESIGLITAANEVVNDPSSVGTALKTLTLRLRGSKTELQEMGEDVSDMATTTSQLQAKLLALTGGQVDIMLDENTFKNSTQILREMAAAWSDMNDIQRASALELMGGKRQANVLSALIQNFDTVENVIETSANSAGSALKENERYLDSIQGKIDQFNNAMQAMWSNALDSDWVKGFVNFGTILVKIIDKIGLLNSALIALAAYSMIKNKMGPIAFFGGISDMIRDVAGNVKGFIGSLTGMTAATSAYTAETLAASVANGTLSASEAASMATKSGLTLATTNLTAAEAAEMLTKSGMSKADALALVSKLGLTKTTSALTMETVKATMANAGYTPTQIASATAALFGAGANATLAASFMSLWAAMWPVLLVMLAIVAVVGIVKLFDELTVSAKEASEQLEETKSKIEDLESELETLKTDLDEVREKIAELTALPYLSLVQQEELDKLERQAELLERQIALKERQLAIEEAKLVEDSELAVEKNWGPTDKNKKDKRKVNNYIEEYEKKNAELDANKDLYLNASNEIEEKKSLSYDTWKQIRTAQGFADTSEGTYKNFDWSSFEKGEELLSTFYRDTIGGLESETTNIASKIEEIFNDPTYAGLTYGMSDEIDAFLDDFNNAQLKWEKALYGDNSTASAIESLWGPNASEEMKTVKGEIDKIMAEDGDWASDDEKWQDKNEKIKEYIDSLDATADGYHQLDYVINDLGVTAQDVADYFTVLNGEFNSNTIEGITQQYAKAEEVINALKDMSNGKFTFDGQSYNWDEFFSQDDQGKFKARVDKFAEILKGMDNDTRETFINIVESAANAAGDISKIDWDQALTKLDFSGLDKTFELLNNEFEGLNNELFSNIADDISGLIDTVNELQAALEDVAGTIDLLSTAEEQMANSGQISVKTALDLMETTDDYNKVVTIENGVLKLAAGAQDYVTQAKFNSIKTQLEASAALAETTYQTALASQSELNYADNANVVMTAESIKAEAVGRVSAVIVALGAAMDAISRKEYGSIFSSFSSTYKSATATVVAQSNAMKTSIAELGQRATNTRTLADVYSFADGYNNFKNNYDFDKTPGDKYGEDADSKAEEALDAFQRAMEYWENRIAANQARYEQLQSEIDLLEAKGQKADASYYEEQIKLENERLSLLQQQKAEAQSFLGTFEEGSEEWWEVASQLNDIEGELDDVTSSILDLQDAIAEIDTYKFEEFNTRLDDITSKLETIRDLIAPDGESDWFDDQGQWTEEGVAVLGSYIQELETYKNGLAETAEELEKYNSAYEDNESYYEGLGIHSEQEYYDKVQELTEQQYDFAESISNTKQSIVDMYESNIDAVEEYIETLIDGYNDYIDSVKEALDAERDLYEFKKNVQKQSKDIAELERRIASLSGSTNKSEIAERRKLEAQLYEARESLNDTYYDHSNDSLNNALDAEQSAYEETMNKFIEGLRIGLETATRNMDEFLMGVTSMVMYNADTILSKYEETNLPLTKELTNPWIKAKEAVGSYSGDALDLMNQWTQNGFLTSFPEQVSESLQSPWNDGSTAANAFKTSVSTVMQGVVANISTNVKAASSELSSLYQQIIDTEKRASSANVAVASTGSGGGGGGYVPPAQPKKYYVTATLSIGGKTLSTTQSDANSTLAKNKAKIAITDEYEKYQKSKGIKEERYESSWLKTYRDKVKYSTKYYAKGTAGTSRDEWAITDEPQFGDELTMYATPEGTLSFMRAGSTVVPADITANLVEWGKLNPDMLNVNGMPNISMISNAVNKPELNITFDSLVKAENITEETLPAVRKLVTQELNRFTKELNYALKGKGAR